MNYTKESMQKDLKSLGIWKFDWAGKERDQVRADVKASNPGVTAGGFSEVAEYCWKSYEKSLQSTDDMFIGRQNHLTAANIYERVADIVGNKTLFDPETKGNVLQMDKWAAVMNDAWILGGVHRQARFRLASPRVIENIWNTKGFLIVTARELVGLFTFGYALEQVGPWQILICPKDRAELASSADLIKYDAAVKKGQTPQEAQQLRDKQGSSGRAAQQVKDFKNRS
ncbi:MAG TPA: hypothetical protein VFC86_10435 [Planctomycetota bacterium]|nr:hypothetical protein [Planctomycetota bacterium]